MKLKKFAAVLVLVLLFCLAVGCAKQTDLTGAWRTSIDVSSLGVSADDDTSLTGVLTFSFHEDGTGEMTVTFNAVPISTDFFQYTVEKDQLVINCDSNTVLTYTFNIAEDILHLDGQVTLDLQRAS